MSLGHLARMLRALDDQLVACMRCGFCQAVCPLYRATGREADVARGKLALLDGLARKLLTEPEAVRERLERCLLCGACAANCPTGVKVMDIFLRARAILAGYLGLPAHKKLLFRQVLARPALFNALLALAPKLEPLMTKPADAMLGTSCARVRAGLGSRHLVHPAARPFHKQVALPLIHRGGGPRVALFVGCLVDKLYPEVGLAAVKALKHHGVNLVIPHGQACCGIPVLSAGDSVAFARLMAVNLERFYAGGLDAVLTVCATCTATIKKLWPIMAGELPPEQRRAALELSAMTMDLSQFLAARGMLSPQPPAPAGGGRLVTYHDPCHLAGSLGVTAEPRALLARSPGWRLVEMEQPAACCGMGGSFNLAHYDLSREIGLAKVEDIRSVGPAVVATSCPACMTQLTDLLSQTGGGVAVRHVVELYAEGL